MTSIPFYRYPRIYDLKQHQFYLNKYLKELTFHNINVKPLIFGKECANQILSSIFTQNFTNNQKVFLQLPNSLRKTPT